MYNVHNTIYVLYIVHHNKMHPLRNTLEVKLDRIPILKLSTEFRSATNIDFSKI